MIDPGHGGIDPGAIGNGTMEKTITLAVAKALKKELLATGRFRVALTRDKDVYIPLRDRFKVARDGSADLFISLHADSHANSKTRGASVYTLVRKGLRFRGRGAGGQGKQIRRHRRRRPLQ